MYPLCKPMGCTHSKPKCRIKGSLYQRMAHSRCRWQHRKSGQKLIKNHALMDAHDPIHILPDADKASSNRSPLEEIIGSGHYRTMTRHRDLTFSASAQSHFAVVNRGTSMLQLSSAKGRNTLTQNFWRYSYLVLKPESPASFTNP